jgi:HPt (histidine-containing phosphotransfer) domain-containing protein
MPIDQEKLDILYTIQPASEPDFVKNILHIFISSTEENIALLESSFANNSIDQMTRAAHTIKSSSANIGAMELMEISKELETDCRLNQRYNADKQIEVVKAEFDRVKNYITKHIL